MARYNLADESQIIGLFSVPLKISHCHPRVWPNFLVTTKASQYKLNQPLAFINPKAKKFIKYYLKLYLSCPCFAVTHLLVPTDVTKDFLHSVTIEISHNHFPGGTWDLGKPEAVFPAHDQSYLAPKSSLTLFEVSAAVLHCRVQFLHISQENLMRQFPWGAWHWVPLKARLLCQS